MKHASFAAVLSVGLLLGAAAACSKDGTPQTPTAPSSFATSTPALGAQAISVSGTTTLTQLGQTSQLKVTATFPDGTTRDVTSQASCDQARDVGWFPPYPVVRFSTSCTLDALAYGKVDVSIIYPKPNSWPAPPGSLITHVTARVVPDGSFVVHGGVAQAGYPLAGATVTLTSTSGTRTSTVDESGIYMFAPVDAGEVTVQASLPGYTGRTERVTIGRDEQLDLELQPASPPTEIAGIYRLTFTASSSCSLPGEAQQRIYPARVVLGRTINRPEDVIVTVSGFDFISWGNAAGFVGTREGSTVRFTIDTNLDADYALIEMIDQTKALYFSGSASVTVGEHTMDGLFDGTLTLFDFLTRTTLGKCQASDHRIVFTR